MGRERILLNDLKILSLTFESTAGVPCVASEKFWVFVSGGRAAPPFATFLKPSIVNSILAVVAVMLCAFAMLAPVPISVIAPGVILVPVADVIVKTPFLFAELKASYADFTANCKAVAPSNASRTVPESVYGVACTVRIACGIVTFSLLIVRVTVDSPFFDFVKV